MNTSTEQLFTNARSHNGYMDTPVSDDLLRQIYDVLKWGPTSANSSPARLLFIRSQKSREALLACVSPGNVEKIRQAPVTVVVGMDLKFYEALPKLFPHTDARAWFANDEAKTFETAFRNSSLQGGYLILAARSLGIDCGPMSGFDGKQVDRVFWAGTSVQTNFLCTLGHGDPKKLFPRSPRLSFDEACQLI